MSKYNFDEIIERRGTNCNKYDDGSYNVPEGREVIPMTVADMDFACAQPILDAIKDRVDKRILGYACYSLPKDYLAAVCGWAKRRHNIDCKPENISISTSVVDIVRQVIPSTTREGDGVMYFTPGYMWVWTPITEENRKQVNMPLINNDGYYTIDFNLLEKEASKPENTLLILLSPHNPSGRVWTEEELRKVAEICFKNNVRILVDEIHYDLVRKDKKMISLTSLYPQDPRIITTTSCAKTFNIAGLQHAYLITYDPKIKDDNDNSRFCGSPNPICYSAITAAYDGSCDDWVDEVNEYIDKNVDYLYDFVKENLPKVKMCKPEGTYLAWLDLNAYGLSNKELDERISKTGLILEYGDENFIAGANGFARVNLACPMSTVVKACNCLKEALGD